MQVFTHWQSEVVGCLIGVDNINFVFQSFFGRFDIVEREVHVVGEVAKDILQMCLEGIGDTEFRNGSQLCFQLCCHVGHQLQLILHLVL